MRVGMAMIAAGLAGLAGGAEAQAITFGLKPGQTVRVRTVDGARFVTRLAPVPGPSPTALFEGAETPFFLDRVDSLWVRGRAVRTGAIVGAAIATPAGFAFFAHFCSVFSDGSGCQEWGKVTVFALVTGLGGAAIGATVGALIPHWRLRYARDREAGVSPLLGPGRVGLSVRF